MFDIHTLSGAFDFLRSMYNFTSLVRTGDGTFDPKYSTLCPAVQVHVSDLPSLSSKSAAAEIPQSKTSRARAPRVTSIAEEVVEAMGYELETTYSTVRIQFPEP